MFNIRGQTEYSFLQGMILAVIALVGVGVVMLLFFREQALGWLNNFFNWFRFGS